MERAEARTEGSQGLCFLQGNCYSPKHPAEGHSLLNATKLEQEGLSSLLETFQLWEGGRSSVGEAFTLTYPESTFWKSRCGSVCL